MKNGGFNRSKRGTHLSGDRLISSLSITCAKLGNELLQIDPNEWYKVYLLYIDQIATTAEILKLFWEQHHDELEHMACLIPRQYTPKSLNLEQPLAAVFEDMLNSTSSTDEREGDDTSIGDLPF